MDYTANSAIIIIQAWEKCHQYFPGFYNNPLQKGAIPVQLTVKRDKSEDFAYNTAHFPAYIGRGRISEFPNFTALGHWHDDLEFSLLLSGAMDYNVNGNILRVQAGEGIFVNTRQLHYNFSRDKKDCEYLCILLHPMLLCASAWVERDFVAPVLANAPCQVFSQDSLWGQEICRQLLAIEKCREDPLLIQSAFFQIWSLLYRNTPLAKDQPKPRNQNLNILQEMIGYIQRNYRQRLSLERIAQAGNISKTTCHNIFRKYVNQSPNAYLVEYRLRAGMELLRTTDMTVTEIAYEVGFGSPSYFSESFRKAFGVSPMEYRETHKPEGL